MSLDNGPLMPLGYSGETEIVLWLMIPQSAAQIAASSRGKITRFNTSWEFSHVSSPLSQLLPFGRLSKPASGVFSRRRDGNV